MKQRHYRTLCLTVLAGWLGLAATAWAQNPAAAAAAREEAEDRYVRLVAQINALNETLDLHRQQITALERSIKDLSEQVTRANNNNPGYATREGLEQVGKQIGKVDEARVADTKKIYESIDELQRILKNLSAAPPPPPRSPPPSTGSGHTSKSRPANEEGFEYSVQKGDTLGGIVQAYRQKNIKVTIKGVTEANPTVKWERLRVGQKIFIPKPELP